MSGNRITIQAIDEVATHAQRNLMERTRTANDKSHPHRVRAVAQVQAHLLQYSLRTLDSLRQAISRSKATPPWK